jgi:DNA repair exonuclease SbcCD nuclease subunit
MVKCLVIGDPHFQVNNVEDCEQLIENLIEITKKESPDFIVVLGDLLHTHERIHTIPLKMATKLLRELSNLKKTFLLIGNHDLISNQEYLSDNHAFNSFKYWGEQLIICDSIKEYSIKPFNFVFCPYVPNGRFKEAIGESLINKNPTCIFAHQEFKGCYLNPVAMSENGDQWEATDPFVISGHIHNEQWVNENIWYVGSSMQHAFGESDKKCVGLVKFDVGGSKPEIKLIETGLTKKKIVYLDISKAENFRPEENTQTKIVLKGTAEEFKAFRKSSEYTKLSELGLKISFIPKEETLNHQTPKKREIVDILKELVKEEPENVQRALNRILN